MQNHLFSLKNFPFFSKNVMNLKEKKTNQNVGKKKNTKYIYKLGRNLENLVAMNSENKRVENLFRGHESSKEFSLSPTKPLKRETPKITVQTSGQRKKQKKNSPSFF